MTSRGLVKDIMESHPDLSLHKVFVTFCDDGRRLVDYLENLYGFHEVIVKQSDSVECCFLELVDHAFKRCSKYTVYRDALFGCLFANGLNVRIDDSLRDLIKKNQKTDEETYKELEAFAEGALDYLLLFGIVILMVEET